MESAQLQYHRLIVGCTVNLGNYMNHGATACSVVAYILQQYLHGMTDFI